jgi:hypothetical protein
MGVVMIRCPASGRDVSTGIEVDAATFDALPNVSSRMHCPACGAQHDWSKTEAWLADDAGDPSNGGTRG